MSNNLKTLGNKNPILLITSIAVTVNFISAISYGYFGFSTLFFVYIMSLWYVASKKPLWADLMLLGYLALATIGVVPFLDAFNVHFSVMIMSVEMLPLGLIIGLFVTSDDLTEEVKSWVGTPEEEKEKWKDKQILFFENKFKDYTKEQLQHIVFSTDFSLEAKKAAQNQLKKREQ